jgi:hypothetical protein
MAQQRLMVSRTSIAGADAYAAEPGDFGDGNGIYHVVAWTDYGNNFLLCHRFESREEADATARKVVAAGLVDGSRWVFWRTTYGSEAAEAEAAEAEAAEAEAAEAEAAEAYLYASYLYASAICED